jgi:4-hydroxybenzoate polyprenyltransferase
LVRGTAGVKITKAIMIVLFLAGNSCAYYAGLRFGLLATGNSLLLALYSLYWKRRPWIGNIAVAVLGATCFIYGGLFQERWYLSLIPAGFAFLVHWAREIIKDLEDLPGDSQSGAATLPVVRGTVFSLYITRIILVCLALALPLPFLFKFYHFYYLAVSLPTVAVPVLGLIAVLRRPLDRQGYGRVSLVLKGIMITGILALISGRWLE